MSGPLHDLCAQPAQPAQPEPVVNWAVGVADTPRGQQVAIALTILCGRDMAAQVTEGITKTVAAMSSTGLVVAQNGAVPKAQG